MRDQNRPAATAGPLGGPVTEIVGLPLDFEGFVLGHQAFFHTYAELHLGSRPTAETVVHEVFLEIHAAWDGLLQEDELERRTLAVLHRHVARRLAREGRDPAYVINGQIQQRLRALRGELELSDSRLGLYAAISELPVRQYTVIVLRYLIGHSTKQVARFMSLDERTVNYHCRKAKDRLARQLGVATRAVRQKGQQQ
ncbi:sigma-70 family RNA polymerase sigma factor [Streptomyces bacillaris]|uniref:sigma-70 family RNA polymerase sigma factor n=1 Tax=Streptomyces bacillaris TaxID=68179 RepID=UPI003688E0ED